VQRSYALYGGLLAVGALWLASRTERGQVVAVDAMDTVVNALTPRGYRNNNPGNLRYLSANAWNGQVGNDGGFGVYATKEAGTRALGKQLLKYGLSTVRGIIGRWAPPHENDTGAYVASVSAALGVAPDSVINVHQRLPALARAIAKHENGYVDSSFDFDKWVYLA
jgi:hypothetical protein